MQIVSSGDNLHEMSKPVIWKNKKYISKCRLLKFLFNQRAKRTVAKLHILNTLLENRSV